MDYVGSSVLDYSELNLCVSNVIFSFTHSYNVNNKSIFFCMYEI